MIWSFGFLVLISITGTEGFGQQVCLRYLLFGFSDLFSLLRWWVSRFVVRTEALDAGEKYSTKITI